VSDTRTIRLVGYSDEDGVRSLGFCETADGDGWALILLRGDDGERCLTDSDARVTYAPFRTEHEHEHVVVHLSDEAAETLELPPTLTLVLDCPADQVRLVREHLEQLST
jgi:hypothetical protein